MTEYETSFDRYSLEILKFLSLGISCLKTCVGIETFLFSLFGQWNFDKKYLTKKQTFFN